MADTLTLTNPIPIAGEGGGGGIMYVTITETDSEHYEIDKTYNELLTAVNDRKLVAGMLTSEIPSATDPEVPIHNIEIMLLDALINNQDLPFRYRASFGGGIEVESNSPDGVMRSEESIS